ncbi:hypothetical protein PV414_40980, partial [Streptomyces scabiei]|nr:hypothetical protein [Streptomyces scabiei]
MHRPTTTATATLLVTVAVSALSGCVTTHRPPPPQASPVPSLPSEPRPDGTGGTAIVQALSLIHYSEPTIETPNRYAVF